MPRLEPLLRTDPKESDDILALAPSRIGRVSLVVRDLERTGRFYREAIGMDPIGEEPGALHLGVKGRVRLSLRHDPNAQPRQSTNVGLYHTAFPLPSREDLGSWLTHAAQSGLLISGACDHLVSEAVYLSDPEGNGIEVYADRPNAKRSRIGGVVQMGSTPLVLPELMRIATGRRWAGMPSGGSVGHVHLQVGDLALTDSFYATLLGFQTHGTLRSASFYGSGGYHHQLARNICNSAGGAPRGAGSSGLSEVHLLLRDPADFEPLSSIPAGAGIPRASDERDVLIKDPSGTRLHLTTRVSEGRAS